MVFPLLFLVAGLIIAVVYHTVFPPRGANLDGIAFYTALSLTSYTMLVIFQRFVEKRSLHIPLSIGWGLVFLGTFEKLNADVVDTAGLENENFFSAVIFFGLVLVAIGLYSWIRESWRNQRYLEQQHRVIDLYTSLMTHDAGNDLQAVLGYLELTLSRCHDCKKDVIEVLEAAKASAMRMTSLVKAFRASERDSGETLVQLLQQVSEQAETAHLGLKITLEVMPGLENVSVAGETLFGMALANIFRNAADYAGPNPVVGIVVSKNEDCVVVTLTDSGPGIPPEQRENIFQRGASALDHGMGLYLTRQIVLACQGAISLEDVEHGASFRIELPILQ